jgi:hypothetical protein
VAANDALAGVYAAGGDSVADVDSPSSLTDTTPAKGTPLDALPSYEWTSFCTAGDVHPKD